MRTLTYAGKDFSEFSCWWDGSQVFEKPAKIAQNYQIPFRNGDLIRSTEAFENVPIRFNCFIKENYEENYSELVNFLNSFDTYQRLETSAEPSIYRMAFLHAVIEPETGQFLKDGQFTIVFDCMPQEWLKSGEEEFSIDMQTNSYAGNPVTYEDVFGDSVVDSLMVEFEPQQDLHGYDYPWAGGAGKNKIDCAMLATVTNKGVTMYSDQYGRVYLDGTATADGSFTLATNFVLPSGSYYLNGLADGAGFDSFYYSMSSGGAIIAYGSNDETQLNGGTYSLYLNFVSGQVFNNTVFAPMIRKVGQEPYFEPYSNICHITGHTSATVARTGKNLLPYPYSNASGTRNGVMFDVNSDGTIHIYGTATAQTVFYLKPSFEMKAGTYIVSGEEGGATNTYSYRIYDTNGTIGYARGEDYTFTLDEDKAISMSIYIYNGCTLDRVFTPMIRSASETDATYEPYQGQTYTTSLGQTVYGGSLDLVTGVLTVDTVSKSIGSFNWTDRISNQNRVYATVTSMFGEDNRPYYYPTEAEMLADGKNRCDKMPVENTSQTATRPSVTIGVVNGYFYINGVTHISGVTNKTTLNTWLDNNPLQVTYKLATPQTIQLTSQQISLLQGTNIFSSDVSDVAIIITEGTTLTNPSYMKARPLIILNGSGTGSVMLNGEEVVYIGTAPSNVPLYIDCETMDCYSIVNGETVNENRHVTLPEGYIELQKGDNRFTASGNLEPTMIPRWWRL